MKDWQAQNTKRQKWVLSFKNASDLLVQQKALPVRVKDVLNDAYSRSLVIPRKVTCYKMTVIGSRLRGIENDKKTAIVELQKLQASGKVNKATIDKVIMRLARDYSFLEAMGKVREKNKDNYQKIREEQIALLEVFDNKEKGKIFKPTEADLQAAEALFRLQQGKIPTFKSEDKTKAHWQAVINQWKELRKQIADKVTLGQGAKWQERQKIKKEKLDKHKKEIAELVSAKRITPRVAEVMSDAYGQMVEKILPAIRETCYDVTAVGGRVMSIDFDREKALSELMKLKASGKVNKATVDKVLLRLARDYSLVKAIWDVHKSVKDWKKKEAKQMEILDIFEGKEKGKIFKPTEDDMKAVKILYDLWDGKIPENSSNGKNKTSDAKVKVLWKSVRNSWMEVDNIIRKKEKPDQHKILVDAMKKNIESLVTQKALEKEEAKPLLTMYSQAVQHRLMANMVCYAPQIANVATRPLMNLRYQLTTLQKKAEVGEITKDVAEKAIKRVQQDLEFMARLEALNPLKNSPDRKNEYKKAFQKLNALWEQSQNGEQIKIDPVRVRVVNRLVKLLVGNEVE